jgi:hypothetical protein
MKEIKLTIPEYISIGQYQEMSTLDKLEPLERMLKVITTLTPYTEQEIRQWTLPAIAQASNALMDVTIGENEFHSVVEFKGELYGFSNLSRNKFSEFIDLQGLLKNPTENLHQIAAILYRPITKHRFESLSFGIKHGTKVAVSKIKDPFKWYSLDKYDSEVREERSVVMKDFPVQLILGAMGFISVTGTLSLNGTLYSMDKQTKILKDITQKSLLQSLSQSIGGGGGLFTHSRKPIFFKLPEIPVY